MVTLSAPGGTQLTQFGEVHSVYEDAVSFIKIFSRQVSLMVFGKNKAGFNFVHQDQIWKDHIGHEHNAMKHWPENWGFLIGQYKELANEDSSVENGAAAVRVKQRREALKLPPIDAHVATQLSVGKSVAKFPVSTSEEVGWRSSQSQCNLERYGRYTKARSSFLGQMKWPPEAID